MTAMEKKKRGLAMDRVSTRVNGQLKTIGRCISVAFQQARQSEIEVPSKRRFRLLYEAGNGSIAHLRDSSPGKRNLPATSTTQTQSGVHEFQRG